MLCTLKTEKINFLTHFISMLFWIPLTAILVFISASKIDFVVVSIIYGLSAITLFYFSSSYHRHKKEENEISVHRKLDHIAIFIMIAGTYTPVLWLWFDDPSRFILLGIEWGFTIFGLLWNLFAPKKIRLLEVILYLGMGWVAVWAFKPLFDRMPLIIFLDLVIGGLFYSVGAVIYAIKKPNPVPGVFGFHEIFHFLIIGGAAFHYSLILRSLLFKLPL